MVGLVFLPALAALMAQGDSLPLSPGSLLAHDSAVLAHAISGQPVDLALRGAGLAVRADALPAENGCAARLTTTRQDRSGAWSRLLRWNDVAWTGALPDGRILIAFFEQEGRLPGDRLALAAADPAAFRAALARVIEACRAARPVSERVVSGEYTGSRSCYFARHPGLELVEGAGPMAQAEPTRAIITVLSAETPEAELRVIVERDVRYEGEDWERAEVAFTVAGAALREHKIAAATFALDGAPAEARHSLAIYNDTRLRIRMDPFAGREAAGEETFFSRLSTSARSTVTLIDKAGAGLGVLTFEIGPALVAARQALDTAGWSCAAAAPMPAPAAQWQVAA